MSDRMPGDLPERISEEILKDISEKYQQE